MKILIVDNSAIISKEKSYFTNSLNGLFLDELTKQGNQISYFQFSIEKESINSYNLIQNGIKCHIIKYLRNKILRYIIAYIKIIPFLFRNDFIYFYYPTSFKYVTIICIIINKKYGLYIRGMNKLNDNISYHIYKHAYTIFTVSDYFTEMINKIVHSNNLAHTIRPMIQFSDNDINYTRKYEIKSVFTILYLGRIAKEKGILELLYSVKELKNKKYNFKLEIVGTGEYLEESKLLVKSLQIEDIVHFEGAVTVVNEVKQYYKKADLFILPSYHEGFARTLYEAMIFGTPILTTFVGGIKAIMKNDYNCLEITPQSIESITTKLEFAFHNYSKMVELAKNGFDTVAKIVDNQRLTHAQHLNQIIKNNV